VKRPAVSFIIFPSVISLVFLLIQSPSLFSPFLLHVFLFFLLLPTIFYVLPFLFYFLLIRTFVPLYFFFLLILSFTYTCIFHLPLSFINVLQFFMVSPFVTFSAWLYFLYSFIFLPIVEAHTMMSDISYIKLNMTNLYYEYFLHFLFHKTVAGNKQGIRRDSLSAFFISILL